MGTLLQQGDQFIESSEQADNKYGQNGYQGSSSDLPGKRTTSGFLPEVADTVQGSDWQTRTVDASPIAKAKGMQRQNSAAAIPSLADVAPQTSVFSSARRVTRRNGRLGSKGEFVLQRIHWLQFETPTPLIQELPSREGTRRRR
jgi:hypothetical protein